MTKYSNYYNNNKRSLYEDDIEGLNNDVENAPIDEQDNKYAEVINFLNCIEGYKIRLRELHWSADSNAMHKLTDDCISKITGYEDTLAEDLMGINDSTIGVGMLKPIQPKSVEFKPLIIEILTATINLKQLLSDDINYSGICNVLDDMIHNIDVTKYLERFK